MALFAKDVGIDLGTANTLVYVKGKGVTVNEPSIVAYDEYSKKIFAVGEAAKEMVGRASRDVSVIKPMKDGVIADFTMTEAMLRYFVKKAQSKNFLFGPRVCVCVPSEVTEVERRAVEDVVKSAGARKCFILDEPMAAAVGADLAVEKPSGCMVADIGGGTTEVAVISLGGMVTNRSVPVAGNFLDAAIAAYVRKEFNLFIGEATAENIKIELGSALPYDGSQQMAVTGRDLLSGLPKSIEISQDAVREAMAEGVGAIVDAILQVLEKTPPELSADVMENGIVLSGGGANIRNLDRLITRETGIRAVVAQNPLECAVLGTGKALGAVRYFS